MFQCMRVITKMDEENSFRIWIKRVKLCIKHRGKYVKGMKEKIFNFQFQFFISDPNDK